ncbi:MAG: APC family permease, partial [Thermoplasmata archaeon]
NITDFMVLISLAIIALTGTRLREATDRKDRVFYISIITFAIFIFAAANIYLLDRMVVILGVIAIIISYVIYDVIKIGLQGIEFFAIFIGSLSIMVSLVFRTLTVKKVVMLNYILIRSPYNVQYMQVSIAVMLILILMNSIQRIMIKRINV